jgi:ribosomal protein S18 acetylase RimI-like enzyme
MPMPNVTLRSYCEADAAGVNELALAAFDQFRSQYSDWQAMASGIGRMSALADVGEIIIAERDERIIGAVAYIGPGRPKATFFDQSWPIIRMLVVDPFCRGGGVGRALTEECMKRARRDGSPVIALHTSPIMTVALPMYLRMGFQLARDAPPIYGVPYAVYLRQLDETDHHRA